MDLAFAACLGAALDDCAGAFDELGVLLLTGVVDDAERTGMRDPIAPPDRLPVVADADAVIPLPAEGVETEDSGEGGDLAASSLFAEGLDA